MKKLNLIALAIGITFSVACNDTEKSTDANNETQQTTENTAQDATAADVKVNPAHGLPGHRCDLPVGAPLNGTAGTTANPTPTSQLPATSVSPVRVDQTPTVNPPHGEPGHDCAVPVGAPLNK
ncbi:hypothetical protein [Salinimicrobium oceani]|uniref:Secreted protein n=1 Tax=Salinimicrobium oceani TaxID=2722702 RepID=A0ABX1CUW7_9FLAO|nr:hypothetical protein [Salinimicrobium oceani]NJW52090.1 hypothetical protein [Salinimicrobium oceani]